MSQGSEVPVWVPIGSLFVTGFGLVSGFIYWCLNRLVESRINEAKTDMRTLIETEIRATGETGAAIREKMHLMETWNRDNFVRREDFKSSMDQINQKIDRLDSSVSEKLDRLLSRA